MRSQYRARTILVLVATFFFILFFWLRVELNRGTGQGVLVLLVGRIRLLITYAETSSTHETLSPIGLVWIFLQIAMTDGTAF